MARESHVAPARNEFTISTPHLFFGDELELHDGFDGPAKEGQEMTPCYRAWGIDAALDFDGALDLDLAKE